jgi:exodeoxyribonuclease V
VARPPSITCARKKRRLIYRARESEEETPSFDLWHDSPAAKARLIVIDECSMVDAELGRDLLSFGAPVLVLGDPAQLPPIQGGGFFTDQSPDAMLTEVHRQALGDPIVQLSMEVRAGRPLAPIRHDLTEVVRRGDFDPARALETNQILVGRNVTRRAYNARLRERRGLDGTLPVAGDKLVCLRNNRRKGLFNGGLWVVKKRGVRKSGVLSLRLMPEDEVRHRALAVSVRPECFTGGIEQMEWMIRKRYEEFDYGYVLTVHKAQGSQWDDVVLFDESFAFPETRERWLYTGITRAVRRLTVVV